MKRTGEQSLRDDLARAALDVERAQSKLLRANGAVDLALAARRAAEEALDEAETRGRRTQDALDHLTGALDREPLTRAELDTERARLIDAGADPAELAEPEPIRRKSATD